MAQPLMWLMLIAIAMGKCLMNGYEIDKVQPIHRNGEQVRENILSPVSTVRDDLYGLIFEIFYFLSDVLFCLENRFTYC